MKFTKRFDFFDIFIISNVIQLFVLRKRARFESHLLKILMWNKQLIVILYKNHVNII